MSAERYVKQIVSDVMEMAAKIKFLEAKVAASESWNAECTDDHKRELAAALRRAKAEGAREMIKIVKAHKADQRVADDLNNTVSFDSFNEVLDAITREADARAAQIEEGE